MDGFIKYMKRELIGHNFLAALYTVSCIVNMLVGLDLGLPWGVVSWLCSFWMGHWAIKEAQQSKMSAKILDQARKQQQEMEE